MNSYRFVVTISAWTEPGCKDPNKDPNASKGDGFKNGLSGWCSTKKAGAVFFWLAFGASSVDLFMVLEALIAMISGFWLASLGLLIMDWRSGKMAHPRDPPFYPPAMPEQVFEDGEDEESSYTHIPPVQHHNSTYGDSNANVNSPFSDANRYRGAPPSASTPGYAGGGLGAVPAGRPSMDVYGAFSDPPPSGFGGSNGGVSPTSAPPPMSSSGFGGAPPMSSSGYGGAAPVSSNGGGGAPAVSRTMQYADPYAAVRASIGTPPETHTPPSYESYQGYR